jgi:hypothetical protein
VASLAAPVLTKQHSQVSVATVTAGINSEAEDEGTSVRGKPGSVRKTSAELPRSLRKTSLDYLRDSKRESVDHLRDLRRMSVDPGGMLPANMSHKSNKSRAFSIDTSKESEREGGETEKEDKASSAKPSPKSNAMNEKRKAAIRAEEQTSYEIGWDALREAFDRFAIDVKFRSTSSVTFG